MLLAGIALMAVGIGFLVACIPRRGKKVWFVGTPLLEPVAPLLMILLIVCGAVLVTGHMLQLDIDDFGLSRAIDAS